MEGSIINNHFGEKQGNHTVTRLRFAVLGLPRLDGVDHSVSSASIFCSSKWCPRLFRVCCAVPYFTVYLLLSPSWDPTSQAKAWLWMDFKELAWRSRKYKIGKWQYSAGSCSSYSGALGTGLGILHHAKEFTLRALLGDVVTLPESQTVVDSSRP